MISVHVWLMRVKTLDRPEHGGSSRVLISRYPGKQCLGVRDKHNTALATRCFCPSSVLTSPPVATDMKINIIVSKDMTWHPALMSRPCPLSSGVWPPPSSRTPFPGLTECRCLERGRSVSSPGPRSSPSLGATDSFPTPSSTWSSWLTLQAATGASSRAPRGGLRLTQTETVSNFTTSYSD